MAAVSHLVATPDTGNTPNTSGSFTPTAGNLLVALIVTSGSSGTAGTLTSSANGITWTRAETAFYGAGAHTVNVYVADQLVPGSPAAMTVTWTPTDTGTGSVIFVAQVSGMTRTGLTAVRQTAKQDNQTSGTAAPVFASAALTGNPTLGVVGLEGAGTSNTAVPPASTTERGDTGFATPNTGGEYWSRDSGFTGTTVTWTSHTVAIFGAITIELDTSSAAAVFDQAGFRARNDDGDETTATWKAAENANWSQVVDTVFRLRFVVDETSSVGAIASNFQLQRSLNAGPWLDVNATSAVAQSAASAIVTNGTATTRQLTAGTGTFHASEVDTNNGSATTGVYGAGDITETEYSLQILAADVANGDTIQFRVNRAGVALDTYTQTPTVTVAEPVPPIVPLMSPMHLGVVVQEDPSRLVGATLLGGEPGITGTIAAVQDNQTMVAASLMVPAHWDSEEDKWVTYATNSEVNRAFKAGDATASHNLPASALSIWSHADTVVGDVDVNGTLITAGIVKNSLVLRSDAGVFTGQTYSEASGIVPAWKHPSHPTIGFTPMDMAFDGVGTATANTIVVGWAEPTTYGTAQREGLLMRLNAFTGAGAFTEYSLNNGTFFVHAVYNDATHHYLMAIEFVEGPGGPFDTLGMRRYIRLARVALGSLTTPASWTYWNGSTWVSGVANATRLLDTFGLEIEGTPDVTKVGSDYVMAVMTVSSGAVRLYKSTSMGGPWVPYAYADVPHRPPDAGGDPPANAGYWRGFPKFHEYLNPSADTLVLSHSFGLYKVDPEGADPPHHISQNIPNFLFLPTPAAATDDAVGVLTATQANQTSTITGVLGYSGTIAVTQEDQTSTIAGTVAGPAEVTGTIAATQADQTSTITGTAVGVFTGTIAATQDDQTSAISGTVSVPAVTGTIAATQDNQTSSISGTVTPPVTGTIAVTQADQTSTISGNVGVNGTIAVTQDSQTGVLAGWITITGTIAVTQADQASSITGIVTGVIPDIGWPVIVVEEPKTVTVADPIQAVLVVDPDPNVLVDDPDQVVVVNEPAKTVVVADPGQTVTV